MRVKAIFDEFVRIGKEYEVHGICNNSGDTDFLVLDGTLALWRPVSYFKIVDHAVPGDWQCTLVEKDSIPFPDDGGTFEMNNLLVIGPEFLIKEPRAIGDLLLSTPEGNAKWGEYYINKYLPSIEPPKDYPPCG